MKWWVAGQRAGTFDFREGEVVRFAQAHGVKFGDTAWYGITPILTGSCTARSLPLKCLARCSSTLQP